MVPAALAIVLAAGCGPTVVTNNTDSWTEVDQKSFKSATERCVFYYEDSPCLKSFEKMEENVYRAICSERVGK